MRKFLIILALLAVGVSGYLYFAQETNWAIWSFIASGVLFFVMVIVDAFASGSAQETEERDEEDATTSSSRPSRGWAFLSSAKRALIYISVFLIVGMIMFLLGNKVVNVLSGPHDVSPNKLYMSEKIQEGRQDTIVRDTFLLPEDQWVKVDHLAYTITGDTVIANYFIPGKSGTYYVRDPLGKTTLRLEYYSPRAGTFSAFQGGDPFPNPIQRFFNKNHIMYWKSKERSMLTRQIRYKTRKKGATVKVTTVSQ